MELFTSADNKICDDTLFYTLMEKNSEKKYKQIFLIVLLNQIEREKLFKNTVAKENFQDGVIGIKNCRQILQTYDYNGNQKR